MINNISWQGYWIAIALILPLYYSFVSIIYFKSNILQWFDNKSNQLKDGAIFQRENLKKQPELFPANPAREDLEAPENGTIVSSLIDEIQAFFEATGTKDFTKEALLQKIKGIIQKYPSVKGSTYQYSVNNLLLFLAEQSCSIHLSAEDVSGVWIGE